MARDSPAIGNDLGTIRCLILFSATPKKFIKKLFLLFYYRKGKKIERASVMHPLSESLPYGTPLRWKRNVFESSTGPPERQSNRFCCRSKCWTNLISTEPKLILTAQFASPPDNGSASACTRFTQSLKQTTGREKFLSSDSHPSTFRYTRSLITTSTAETKAHSRKVKTRQHTEKWQRQAGEENVEKHEKREKHNVVAVCASRFSVSFWTRS